MLFLVANVSHAKVTTLKIAVSGFSGIQREAFLTLARNFEHHYPRYKVAFILMEDHNIKSNLPNWLAGERDFDLAVWHAGEPLKAISQKRLLHPITTQWKQNGYDKFFSDSMKQACSSDGEIYGLPISMYQWGFYYSKKVFNRLKLKEPQNWQEFLTILATLKQHDIVPLQLASKSNWPVAGWYEYLNLRLNGLDAQKRLSNIHLPLDKTAVKNVLDKLRELVVKDYFTRHHRTITWKQSLPDIYRGKTGMALYGNFVESVLGESTKNLVGYFPVPIILDDYPRYEVAPTDILMVSHQTKHLKASMTFLNYVAQPDTQSRLNENLLQISPNALSDSESQSHFVRKGRVVIADADGFTQYFDRDAPKAISEAYIRIWKDFIDNPDINLAIAKMQQHRRQLVATAKSG